MPGSTSELAHVWKRSNSNGSSISQSKVIGAVGSDDHGRMLVLADLPIQAAPKEVGVAVLDVAPEAFRRRHDPRTGEIALVGSVLLFHAGE